MGHRAQSMGYGAISGNLFLASMVTAMYSTNDGRGYKNITVIIGLIFLVLGVRYRLLVTGNWKKRRDMIPQGSKACGSGF